VGDLLVWIFSQQNASVVWAVVAIVVVEFALDIVHDLFMDWFRKWREERKNAKS